MPPSPATIARDARILAGYRAGRSLVDLAFAENTSPEVVRRVLRDAGIDPGSRYPAPFIPDRLQDADWLRAEYATKSAKQIARELGCSHEHVYAALHAAGIPPHVNGRETKCEERIAPELAERAVSFYVRGLSAELVADIVGLSADQVSRLVEERGVRRSRSEAARLAHATSARPFGPEEWSSALRAEVLDRYARGQSGEMIADLLELPASSVYRLLRDRGVLRSRGRRRGKLRASGELTAAVESKPGRRRAPAEWTLVELLAPNQAAEALARYAEGEAPGAIAAGLGVPRDRVYRFLREQGVLRSRSEAMKLRWAQRRELEQ